MNALRTVAALLLTLGGIAALPAQAQQAGFTPTGLQFDVSAAERGYGRAPGDFARAPMAANARAFDVGRDGYPSSSGTSSDAIAGASSAPELRFADQQPLGPTMFDDPAIW